MCTRDEEKVSVLYVEKSDLDDLIGDGLYISKDLKAGKEYYELKVARLVKVSNILTPIKKEREINGKNGNFKEKK